MEISIDGRSKKQRPSLGHVGFVQDVGHQGLVGLDLVQQGPIGSFSRGFAPRPPFGQPSASIWTLNGPKSKNPNGQNPNGPHA